MNRRARTATSCAFALVAAHAVLAGTASGQTPYKLPPQSVVDLVDAPPPAQAIVSPATDAVLLVDPEAYPPIALLAQPMLRLAGVRITPATGCRQRTLRYTGLSVQRLDGGAAKRVALPAGARIGVPLWSHDGRRFAFARDLADGVELWIGEAATGVAKPVTGVRLNDVLGLPLAWEGETLLARTVPRGRGPAPAAPAVPAGPIVEETAGKASQMATFQDLLKTPQDEALFEHYARSQLVRVDARTLAATSIGKPDLYTDADASPDGRYRLVQRIQRPFSTRVPFFFFARVTEVWDESGKVLAKVAELPVSDEVPRQGVPTGPRQVAWQPLAPVATLVWAEAQDGGDPTRKVPHHDRLLSLAAPFAAPAVELLKLKQRFISLDWTARPGVALVGEHDRSRRWRTTTLVDLAGGTPAKVVFDLSENDAYADPGEPVLQTKPSGERILSQDGQAIYLAGDGASESGDRPFLDRFDLGTLEKQRLFRSAETGYERFVAFANAQRTAVLVRSESKTEPPNLFVVDLASGARRKVTDVRDTTPQLTKVKKELLRYARKDGVPLSGTLYLPADHVPGTRLPALVWAYPLEYSDAATAGQVRGSTNTFPRLAGASPLAFVTRGYAVLMDATMPVVGDPETMNDTYVEQISAAAQAAVDVLDAKGVADRSRVVVGGHSYGAFMTANLLAHTDLFVAGIARSGAYNRTLTPFGFQSERRTFWDAPQLYLRVSPFTYANKINEPILLIHGEADNNSGTFPIQSERLFQALRGSGATARYVVLPNEAHGYRARESVLHTLAEMLEWADTWAKNRPAAAVKP